MKYIVNNNQLMYFYLPKSCDFVIYNKSSDHYVKKYTESFHKCFLFSRKTGISLRKANCAKTMPLLQHGLPVHVLTTVVLDALLLMLFFSSFVICPKLKQEFSDGRNHMNEYLTRMLEYLQGYQNINGIVIKQTNVQKKVCRYVEKKTQLMPFEMLHQTVLKLRNEIVLAHGQGISEVEY